LFRVVSPDLALAKLNGVGRRYNRAMPVNLGMIVTLRIKLVGTPLIGALAIIPASIARDFSQNIGWDVIVSLVLDVRFFV
jgi:ABC-type Mn2+/Zn2+ transport system permease subunit